MLKHCSVQYSVNASPHRPQAFSISVCFQVSFVHPQAGRIKVIDVPGYIVLAKTLLFIPRPHGAPAFALRNIQQHFEVPL